MAVQDLLSQDEIDALLHGVDDGAIDTDVESEPGSIKSYDLTSQDRIVRGRMPTLEMINERFARYTRISMFNLMRRSADVAVGGVQGCLRGGPARPPYFKIRSTLSLWSRIYTYHVICIACICIYFVCLRSGSLRIR